MFLRRICLRRMRMPPSKQIDPSDAELDKALALYGVHPSPPAISKRHEKTSLSSRDADLDAAMEAVSSGRSSRFNPSQSVPRYMAEEAKLIPAGILEIGRAH